MKNAVRAALLCSLLLMLFSLPALAEQPALLSQPGPTFTQAAPQGGWTLIAYGDMRFTNPLNVLVTNPKARVALVNRIAEEKPDALLLSGDVPYDGADEGDYKVYHQESAPWRAAGLHVYPALGNHELHGSHGAENWWNAFPELRNRRWYSVQFGEAYLLAVDSNLDLTPGSEQAKWAEQQLASLPKGTRYVFVAIHHPPVADSIKDNASHNVRPNEEAFAKLLEAAAAKQHVSIVVVAGHIHAYQRFERNGVIYLVSGGGGAKQHEIARTPADLYQSNAFPNFHYIKFVSGKDGLTATMYRLDDKGGFVADDHFTVKAR